jgi:hypothetical protein
VDATIADGSALTAADGGGGIDGAIGDGGAAASGLPWAGVLDPARAIDWSEAGVVGGIPTRTTVCATLNPGATAAQINAAIAACPTGQVVSLTAGTYSISDDGIVMQSGVTLRGAGADKTLLVFSTTNYCSNLSAAICFSGTNDWSGGTDTQPGGTNAADWTGGYDQGATQITLSNVGTPITAGQYIYLDQANDTAVGASFFVCEETDASCSLQGGNGGRVIDGVLRSQIQIVQVTAVSGSTYTITPGLYSPNWRTSQSPGAWWATKPVQNAGLEDLSVDASNSGGQMNVAIYNAMNDWVRGVRLVRTCTCERDLVQLNMAAHCTVADSYFYGTEGQSVNYGVEAYGASDDLVENNVFQHVVAPMVIQPSLGSVYAYNYAINDTYADSEGIHWVQDEFIQHNAGVESALRRQRRSRLRRRRVPRQSAHEHPLPQLLPRHRPGTPGRHDRRLARILHSIHEYRRQRPRDARNDDDLPGDRRARRGRHRLQPGRREHRGARYRGGRSPGRLDAAPMGQLRHRQRGGALRHQRSAERGHPLRERRPGDPDAPRVVLSREQARVVGLDEGVAPHRARRDRGQPRGPGRPRQHHPGRRLLPRSHGRPRGRRRRRSHVQRERVLRHALERRSVRFA